jgi:Ca2+-binding EF-hand superfamily protein
MENLGSRFDGGRKTAAQSSRRTWWSMSLAAACLTCVAGTSAAQSGRMFDRLDSNGDNVIEQRELDAARRAMFKRADADADDYVTGDEVNALAEEMRSSTEGTRRGGAMRGRLARRRTPERGADRLDRIDGDGDGRISEAEFVGAPNPLLERFDGDRDGRITRAEMDEARVEARERFRRRRPMP